MKHSSAGTRPDGEVLEQLQLSERSDEIREWLLETSSARGLRPVGVVDTRVALSPRSVDSLVAAYETLRREPFKRSGRSRLIPVSEVERLVDFANTRTARRPQ